MATELDMVELLRARYTKIAPGSQADRYSRAEHARYPSSIGYNLASRIADYIVFDTYGRGEIIGHEIKCSRSDWLKELSDLSKSEEWRKHCNKWFLVASDKSIVKDDLPDGWGLMVPDSSGALRVMKRPVNNENPIPLTIKLTAYLCRAISKTARNEIARDNLI